MIPQGVTALSTDSPAGRVTVIPTRHRQQAGSLQPRCHRRLRRRQPSPAGSQGSWGPGLKTEITLAPGLCATKSRATARAPALNQLFSQTGSAPYGILPSAVPCDGHGPMRINRYSMVPLISVVVQLASFDNRDQQNRARCG